MRDRFVKEGMSLKAARTKAAKIFNATKKKGEGSVGRHKSSHKHT